MATETTQRIKDFTDEDFSLSIEAPCMAAPVLVGRETPRVAPMDSDTLAPVPEPRDGVLVRIGRSILSFYDWISGPPTSKRQRLDLYLESTKIERQIGPFMYGG